MIKPRIVLVSMTIASLIIFTQSPRAAADDAPLPGSAFVRFISGDSGLPLSGIVGGKEFYMARDEHIGAYIPVAPGESRISAGSEAVTFNFKEGGRYSAILDHGKLSVLKEPDKDNEMKIQIVLINISGKKNISLKTADGSIDIINAVDPGRLGARMINAVRVALAVYAGNTKIAALEERYLDRGTGYAVVVFDSAKGTIASYDKATGL